MARKAVQLPQVSFEKPVVSSRHYIAKGPSGWAESFDRKKLDACLAALLGAVPAHEAVSMFITQRELSDDREPTNWHTVIGFLGRILGVSPLAIPVEAALAFWGQVELALNDQGTN